MAEKRPEGKKLTRKQLREEAKKQNGRSRKQIWEDAKIQKILTRQRSREDKKAAKEQMKQEKILIKDLKSREAKRNVLKDWKRRHRSRWGNRYHARMDKKAQVHKRRMIDESRRINRRVK